MIRGYLRKLNQRSPAFALFACYVRHTLLCARNLRWPWQMHQAWGTTAYDRHPKVFQGIQSLTAGAPIQSVLSFGCSFGDEAFTLAAYFPNSRIYGADINKQRLKVAESRNNPKQAIFFESTPENLRRHGPFDVIFAKSVFVRHPEDTYVRNLRWLYPFERFEEGVRLLFENAKPGGLMVIYNANYRVMETSFADCLEVVPCAAILQSADVPLFSRDGQKLNFDQYSDQVFRRVR